MAIMNPLMFYIGTNKDTERVKIVIDQFEKMWFNKESQLKLSNYLKFLSKKSGDFRQTRN